MIPPIGNLLLAFLAVLGAFLYPKLPAGSPFTSEQFVQILQWIFLVIAGWNVKSSRIKFLSSKRWFNR
jgi:hypothetical protein